MKRHLAEQNWSEDFTSTCQYKSVEYLWGLFKSKIHELRSKFVPKKKCGMPLWKSKGDIPINQELQNAIREKRRLHRRWISNINNNHYQQTFLHKSQKQS